MLKIYMVKITITSWNLVLRVLQELSKKLLQSTTKRKDERFLQLKEPLKKKCKPFLYLQKKKYPIKKVMDNGFCRITFILGLFWGLNKGLWGTSGDKFFTDFNCEFLLF